MSEGLENCPFCGSKSEFWERSIHDGDYESLIVDCKECSANMEVWVPRFSENFERNVQIAKAELISEWNHREERTAKVINIYSVGNYLFGSCGGCECGAPVIKPDKYCSECGSKLDWSDDE